MSSKPKCVVRVQKLPNGFPCQKIIESNCGLARGTIPDLYMVSEQLNTDKPKKYYPIWTLVRYIANNKIDIENAIEKSVPTSIAFAPILPYPATEFDSIHTCMINFQDVLLQKKLPYGAFWCDENVYRIAKELQLFLSPKFDNLFIGIGGFHTKKNVFFGRLRVVKRHWSSIYIC